jgi:hypothetical protein
LLNVNEKTLFSLINMNTKYMVVVAAMAVMLIGTTALATSENAFASDTNQVVSQVNNCGNDNVGCQNTASQIQGEDNSAALASSQEFED